MKLALLGHFPVEGPPRGGIQSVIAALRDAFIARGAIELHLVQHRRGIPVGTFARAGFTMHNLPASGRRLVPNMLRTPGFTADLLRQIGPDAVSSHQPEYAVAALRLGIPTVHTIHGLPRGELWRRRGFVNRGGSLIDLWLEREMLRRVRHLIAISDHMIDVYRAKTSAHFHRIDNPIAPLFFEPGPPPTPGWLLLVASLVPLKGIETAIAALALLRAQFPNATLDIVGPPTNAEYAAQLRTQAASLGEAVRFLGAQPPDEVKHLLDRAQAAVLSSYQDHAPVFIAEAMASGRPVAATRVGGVASLVADGETGYLVAPRDAAELAAALARMLADPAQSAQMGALAAQDARARFHPDVVAGKYLDAIAAAMAGA